MYWRARRKTNCLQCKRHRDCLYDLEMDAELEARRAASSRRLVVLCPDCLSGGLRIALHFEESLDLQPIPPSEFKPGEPRLV
jgi:hypothetical protein